jgi:hypothetical protein
MQGYNFLGSIAGWATELLLEPTSVNRRQCSSPVMESWCSTQDMSQWSSSMSHYLLEACDNIFMGLLI